MDTSTTRTARSRDDALQTPAQAAERTRAFAHEAIDQAEGKLHELRGTVDPMVEMLAAKAQKLARQSMHVANEAREKAQESLTRYAGVTTRYVAEQPLKSVLVAAAVGAAVALLWSSTRGKNRY